MDESSATLRDSGLLEGQDVEFISFLREEEIYNRSSLSLFIPNNPINDHFINLSSKSRSSPRNTVIQGENLLCYAIFTPEQELINQFSPVLSIKDDEEAKIKKTDPLKRLTEIVKHSAFFENIRFEISFLSISNLSDSEDDLERKIITELNPNHFPQLELDSSEEIIIQNQESNKTDSELPFIILDSAEIVFPLQFPISIKSCFEGNNIKIRVVVTPVSFPEQQFRRLDGILSYLLDKNAVQRVPHHRLTNQIVQLIQPLHVSWNNSKVNNSDFINIFISNNLDKEILLKEFNLNNNTIEVKPVYNSKYEESENKISPIPMSNYFTLTHQHNSLPIILQPGDQYGFVIKVIPNYEKITKSGYSIPSPLIGNNIIQLLVYGKIKLLWETDIIKSPIVSYFPIEWNSPKPEDLLVSISTKSPVPLNELFDIGFTITNLTEHTRNLQLQLNSLWNNEKLKGKYRHLRTSSIHNFQSTNLLCLEKSANIGRLEGNSSTTLNLPFLALDEGIFQIDKIQIIDNNTNEISSLATPCEIFVVNRDTSQTKN